MKLEYIILGVFGIAILYVAVVYIFNSIKMKSKNKPKTEEKPKTTSVVTQTKPTTKPSDEDGKVELKSEVLTEKPVEKAIKETPNVIKPNCFQVFFVNFILLHHPF